MAANQLDTTTYNNVAANTVFDAVLDATAILAWRQNVKNVVNQHATEIDGKITKAGDTMTGLFTLAANLGMALGSGGKLYDQPASLRTVLQANDDSFVIISENGSSTIFSATLAGSAPTFKNLIIYHEGNTGKFFVGTGSPEGVVTAPTGAIYQNTTGGATTTLYVKTSGSGNTGWTAK